MAATETAERRRMNASSSEARRMHETKHDETKHALKTTEFWAMAGVIGAILIAAWVSDSLDDVRAWTLVAAVAIGYMISRGLAKSGTKYAGSEDPLNRDSR
jgi:sugar phosphate permease